MAPRALPMLLLLLAASAAPAADPAPAGDDFFEKEVRPLLVERCLKCHGETKPKSDLKLTSRDHLLEGGVRGPAVARQAGRQPPCPGDSLPGHAEDAADRQARRPRDPNPHPLGRAGRPVAEIGRHRRGGRGLPDHRRTTALLVVPARQGDGTAGGQGRGMGRFADRPLPPGEAQGARPDAGRPRRQAHAAPPRHLRPDRTAADAGGDRRLPGRRLAGGVREGGRSPAGVAGLRRALGPPLARRGPLRRHRRRDRRLSRAARRTATATTSSTPSTPTSRTTSSSASRSPATSWLARPAGKGRRAGDRHRLPRRRPPLRLRPAELPSPHHRGHHRHARQGGPRPDCRLRPLPRPQVRPHLAGRTITPSTASSTAPDIRSPARRRHKRAARLRAASCATGEAVPTPWPRGRRTTSAFTSAATRSNPGPEVPRRFLQILGGGVAGRLQGQRPVATGELADRPAKPADGPRHGQPHLAAPFRQTAWCGRRTTSASRAGRRRTRSCSTTWPTVSWPAAGRSRRCTG